MPSTQNIPNLVSDQEFLDGIFDQAVEQFEDGMNANVDHLLVGREHLRPHVEELVKLAQGVAMGAGGAAFSGTLPGVDGFTVLRELGRGGMGAVYLARQDRLGGRLVALKVLPASAMLSPRARQRFRTEAHAVAKLRHDHIVAVHDIVQDENSHAFAMEWVEGASLARVIDALEQPQTATASTSHQDDARMNVLRTLLDSPEGCFAGVTWPVYVVRMGVAMARALEAVHAAGLLHRDVKPSNILIRRDGTPLLSDFGLARETDATVTNIGAFAGTAAYAAPEQLRGEEHLDHRADIYSLGVSLFHSLALRTPYSGQSAAQILKQVERGDVPPLRKINRKLPADLQTVVAKAIDPEPAHRYQSAREFADDLQRLLNLQPIRAKPAGIVTRIIKLTKRNRRSLVGATIGGALAIGVTALALTYFIGFPIWSKSHLDEARLVLLDPEQSDVLFSALFFHQEQPGGMPISGDAADRALSHYDAAVRFAPFDDDVALEREIVRLARQITQRPASTPVDVRAVAELPSTAEFASLVDSNWLDPTLARNKQSLDLERFHTASSVDLRSLGLLALLCGEPKTTMLAWTELDLAGNSDAIVEASFGMVYLINKEYGRAYPRLRNAVEAFPNVGFLTVYLAEAATNCGDYDKAQIWLNEGANMPRLDRFNGIKRVQAGLYVAVGEDVKARQLYEELFAEKQNIVAFDEYAKFLEAQGDLERAMLVYLRVVSHGTRDLVLYRRFTEATERWWHGLDDADQRQLIDAFQPWDKEYRIDRNGILTMYSKCMADLGEQLPPDGIPRASQVRD